MKTTVGRRKAKKDRVENELVIKAKTKPAVVAEELKLSTMFTQVG